MAMALVRDGARPRHAHLVPGICVADHRLPDQRPQAGRLMQMAAPV